jgi:hypothetical protein
MNCKYVSDPPQEKRRALKPSPHPYFESKETRPCAQNSHFDFFTEFSLLQMQGEPPWHRQRDVRK